MSNKTAVWWSLCGKCGTKVSITAPEKATRDEVKDAFARVGIQVLPCLCEKCLKSKQ